MSLARAVVAGLRGALAAPGALAALQPLLAEPVDDGADADATATRTAVRAVRWLARLPGTRTHWRDTCLYRAVAVTEALRRLGVPARLRLGVAADHSAVHAHAWVEVRGHAVAEVSARPYEPLKPARQG
ncbi:MAG: lasso peptide biosynthesis B2 protein [Gemmatimonadales bacterium]|nr:lasso peptide biosynthesis B2 protein [Gemmatimonadales bacterium]